MLLVGRRDPSNPEDPSPPGHSPRLWVAAIVGLAAVGLGVAIAVLLVGGESGPLRGTERPGEVISPPVIRGRTTLVDFEDRNFDGFDEINDEDAELKVTSSKAYEGNYSARAHIDAGEGNAFARGLFHVDWEEGEDVFYGAALYLEDGFLNNVEGQVDLLRWDNYPSYEQDGDTGGISIADADHLASFKFGTYYGDQVDLVRPFSLPEGRWFRIDVHQHLDSDDGEALTEVFLDGKLMGRSDQANFSKGREIERVRHGLVAIDDDDQADELTLWMDNAYQGTGRRR